MSMANTEDFLQGPGIALKEFIKDYEELRKRPQEESPYSAYTTQDYEVLHKKTQEESPYSAYMTQNENDTNSDYTDIGTYQSDGRNTSLKSMVPAQSSCNRKRIRLIAVISIGLTVVITIAVIVVYFHLVRANTNAELRKGGNMFERERSTDLISMRDVFVRERSFQSVSNGPFNNVPPTSDSLGYNRERSDSVYTSDSIHTSSTVNSEALLVGIKKSVRLNSKKICMVTLIVVNICTIIGLIVALAVVSNGKNKGNENNCQNDERTTASPLSIPQGKTSMETTTLKADDYTRTTTEAAETTTAESSHTSTSSVSTASPSFTLGTWLPWGPWTECSATCGNGIHTRYRECNKTDDRNTDCEGTYVQTHICIDTECTVYGKWTTWSSWASCDVTCNGGTQSRTRSCLKAEASVLDCVGGNSQQQQCAVWDCPDCSNVCSEGDLSPTCELCICNTVRQGIVMTNNNETISNATVFANGNPSNVIAYSDAFGTFSSDIVCDGASLQVEKSGYSSQVCQINSAKITCSVLKNEKPLFNEHPQPKVRLVGENVTLCCSAEGIPDIKYYEWIKGSLLVDDSLYPDGEALTITDLTRSDSGVYKCRANSDAGSMVSEKANVIVKGTESDFCEDSFGQRQIHLPDDCVQPESMTASIETGFCNRQLCRKSASSVSSECREESQSCCTVADFELKTVNCLGYNLSVLTVKSCECGNCNFNTVKVAGTVLYYGTNEYVRFGIVYLNGVFSTYTSSKGYFKVSVNEAYGSVVITVISNNQQATNVIDVSEGTTGTIYTNIFIVQETCSAQIKADEDNVIDIGNCQNRVNTVNTVAEIRIPAYSIIDDSLNIFNGMVNVSLTFLNATDISDLDIMPGLLLSINDEGETVPITTIGAFHLRFYDSMTLVSLKLGKTVNMFSKEITSEQGLIVYGLHSTSGLWHELSESFPAQLNGPDLKMWINIGQYVKTTKECFFNIRIYEDPYLLSEITNTKYQLFVQTIHMDGSSSYETYDHTFSPSRTCFRTICDESMGYIEVWISNFEKESAEYLMPANPMENVSVGLSSEQSQNILYSAFKEDPHLSLKFILSSDGPFFESSLACLSSTQTDNHFKFYFPDSVEDVFTLRHFFDLSTQDMGALEEVSQRVWHPKRQEGYRVCFVKVKFELQTVENIKVRVFSYGGTNTNISNEILGIRQTDASSFIANCLEYKCSGTINEEFSEDAFDDTKVSIGYYSSGTANCTIRSFSQELVDKFSNLNSQNGDENTFTFYAPTSYSPSLGIYSASTSSDDIESARSSAKKECRSGIPMDFSSDNPNTGTAVVFACV